LPYRELNLGLLTVPVFYSNPLQTSNPALYFIYFIRVVCAAGLYGRNLGFLDRGRPSLPVNYWHNLYIILLWPEDVGLWVSVYTFPFGVMLHCAAVCVILLDSLRRIAVKYCELVFM
jgi:hypothetical protein